MKKKYPFAMEVQDEYTLTNTNWAKVKRHMYLK